VALDERAAAAVERLTGNERECLRRCLLPQTAKEMAIDLRISPHAVEKRLKMARLKLGMTSSLQAARLLAEAERGGRYDPLVPQISDLARNHGLRESPQHDGSLVRRAGLGPILGVTAMSIMIVAALVWSMAGGQTQTSAQAGQKATAEQATAFLTSSFELMDRDHSGFVELAEAPERMTVRAVREGAEAQVVAPHQARAMWIAQADSDSDGKVSSAEYVASHLAIFMAQGVPANWKPKS
jgi:DNA-binding CsgD family transcriptional regulator